MSLTKKLAGLTLLGVGLWVLRAQWCRLNGGHDLLFHFEAGRVCLRCVSCGYQTPGWDVRTNKKFSEQSEEI
jgi:hypothetical protein